MPVPSLINPAIINSMNNEILCTRTPRLMGELYAHIFVFKKLVQR